MYTLSLTADELLFILVLYGVVDDEVFERFGLDATDTTKERLKTGEESLRRREIVTGKSGTPSLSDEAIALVGVTVLNDPVDHLYVDEESGLHVRFVREAGMYLFKGEIEE